MLGFSLTKEDNMFKKIILTMGLFLFSTNLFAAQTQIAQVNGMMCIKCQKMVTEALQAASPNATVKVSWPEGVAVSSFEDKSNLSDEDYNFEENFQLVGEVMTGHRNELQLLWKPRKLKKYENN